MKFSPSIFEPAGGPPSTAVGCPLPHSIVPARRFALSSVSATRHAFSLVEMLVVIAVIGLLAAMILGVMPAVTTKRKLSTARAQLENLVTAIERYKAEKGFYPPTNTNDLPASFARTSLFYELTGTTFANNNYKSDRTGEAAFTSAQVQQRFGVGGFLNAVGVGDATGKNYLTGIRPGDYATISGPGGDATFFVVSGSSGPGVIPWNYNSATVNRRNSEGFDLWAEIVISGKTNTISNW